MAGAAAQLADRGAGRCTLAGSLTLETAAWLWRELQTTGMLAGVAEADLSGVTESDSTGLALLLAWRASRRQAGGDVKFNGVPQRLHLLAALTAAQGALASAPGTGTVGA